MLVQAKHPLCGTLVLYSECVSGQRDVIDDRHHRDIKKNATS